MAVLDYALMIFLFSHNINAKEIKYSSSLLNIKYGQIVEDTAIGKAVALESLSKRLNADQWCLEYPCGKNEEMVKCLFDNATETGYCKCADEDLYYDYATGKCEEPDKCILKKVPCGNNEVCNGGDCICDNDFTSSGDGVCKPKIANICEENNPCFEGAECSVKDGTVSCKCKKGQYFDGRECKDGKCFLGDIKTQCDTCPDKFRRDKDDCVPKSDDDKICIRDCGYGYCLKEDGKDVCHCIESVATRNFRDGKCDLKAGLCASYKMIEDWIIRKGMRCNCDGKYKQAEDGITCELKTCSDQDVKDECMAGGASGCVMNWTAARYDCKCPKGYTWDKEQRVCKDFCRNYKDCLEKDQFCFNSVTALNDATADCRCPPTLQLSNNKCSKLAKDVYMISNIPVQKERYIMGKRINHVLLNADLIKSMRKTFKSLAYGYLHSYKLEGNILKCSIWIQFKPNENVRDELMRVFLQPRTFNCDGCDSELTLWPPSLLLSEGHLDNVVIEELEFCSPAVKNALCGETAVCYAHRNQCSCPEGFKPLEYSIIESSEFRIQRCEDIDECRTGIHKCTGNTTCVNLPGDYYCKCKPNYRKNKDTVTTQDIWDKNDCVDLCSLNPCGEKGSCVLTENSFDCRCIEGYEGSFCERTSDRLADAKKRTVVVGAILGTLLGVTLIIVSFVFYRRLKRGLNVV